MQPHEVLSSVHEAELHRQSQGEHDGDGKQALDNSFSVMDGVHDVLHSDEYSRRTQIAPRADAQQMQCLMVG
jgi:hypothetical protein